MSVMKRKWMKSCFVTLSVVLAAAFILISPLSVVAEDKPVTMETLLDRIQIEDMIVKYYVDMSAGKNHDLAMYYTEDAVLDVNGVIAAGHEAIEKLYAGTGDAPPFTAKMNMPLSRRFMSRHFNIIT